MKNVNDVIFIGRTVGVEPTSLYMYHRSRLVIVRLINQFLPLGCCRVE